MRENDHSIDEQALTRHAATFVHRGVLLLVLTLGVAIYFTPLQSWLHEGQIIKSELALFGSAAPLAFTLVAAVLAATGVPRLLLCSLAGFSFGFFWGLLYSQFATVMGSYGTFLFVRWRGRDYTLNHFPQLARFSRKLENHGLVSVLLLRQLPMNGFYNNLFLGLTAVGHRDFLLGTMLGFLPLGVTTCLIGAGLIQADLTRTTEYAALAMASSIALVYLLNRLTNAWRISAELTNND
jgi:uncharacterized membrane protein YdjX (TVP38/TMEM64 family)